MDSDNLILDSNMTETQKMQQEELIKETCGILSDTLCRKNADYGDSFAVIFGEEGWPYAMGHLKEKMRRIDQLRKQEAKVNGESIMDSLMDLAGYCVLTVIELDKKNG